MQQLTCLYPPATIGSKLSLILIFSAFVFLLYCKIAILPLGSHMASAGDHYPSPSEMVNLVNVIYTFILKYLFILCLYVLHSSLSHVSVKKVTCTLKFNLNKSCDGYHVSRNDSNSRMPSCFLLSTCYYQAFCPTFFHILALQNHIGLKRGLHSSNCTLFLLPDSFMFYTNICHLPHPTVFQALGCI